MTEKEMTKELETLQKAGKTEPHIAFALFTHGW